MDAERFHDAGAAPLRRHPFACVVLLFALVVAFMDPYVSNWLYDKPSSAYAVRMTEGGKIYLVAPGAFFELAAWIAALAICGALANEVFRWRCGSPERRRERKRLLAELGEELEDAADEERPFHR